MPQGWQQGSAIGEEGVDIQASHHRQRRVGIQAEE